MLHFPREEYSPSILHGRSLEQLLTKTLGILSLLKRKTREGSCDCEKQNYLVEKKIKQNKKRLKPGNQAQLIRSPIPLRENLTRGRTTEIPDPQCPGSLKISFPTIQSHEAGSRDNTGMFRSPELLSKHPWRDLKMAVHSSIQPNL